MPHLIKEVLHLSLKDTLQKSLFMPLREADNKPQLLYLTEVAHKCSCHVRQLETTYNVAVH